MKKTNVIQPLALLCVMAVIIFAVYLMMKPGDDVAIGEDQPITTTTAQSYESAAYGVQFSYPQTYTVTERDEGSGDTARHTIVLMDKVAAANIPENGEGPTAITIDIFKNALNDRPLDAWIKNTASSNYNLSPDGALSSSTVAGTSSFSYTWDGLYRGESVVLAHNSDAVMLSVTYLDPTDDIRDDFSTILQSLQLK
jgi:hypothetical protein